MPGVCGQSSKSRLHYIAELGLHLEGVGGLPGLLAVLGLGHVARLAIEKERARVKLRPLLGFAKLCHYLGLAAGDLRGERQLGERLDEAALLVLPSG